jgi:hypothetical protein
MISQKQVYDTYIGVLEMIHHDALELSKKIADSEKSLTMMKS